MMRFTLKQIGYFVAAAETGSITLACERVSISQPSISAVIFGLENEFGIQLFSRFQTQFLSLTPQGWRFLREAKSLLLHGEEPAPAGTEISTKIGGVLGLRCLTTLCPLADGKQLRARVQQKVVGAQVDSHAALVPNCRHSGS